MDGIIGREKELSQLESMYAREGFKGLVVYGRRRIGKTTILENFIKDKRALMVYSSQASYYENFMRLKRSASTFLKRDISEIESFSEVMDLIADDCLSNGGIVVFDEFPYLIEEVPFIPSVMQLFVDRLRNSDAMVILCGSSVSMLLKEVHDSGRPLYQRFGLEMEVGPLSLRECKAFHPGMDDLEALKVYMLVGGVPQYHLDMDRPTFRECVETCFLSGTGVLRNEYASIVSELRPAPDYSEVVACIGNGVTKQSKIASKLQLDKGELSRRLKKLEGIGIVSRSHPMLNAPKKPVYRISDGIVSFQYEVLERFDASSMISWSGREKYGLMEQAIDSFLGHRFEDVCAEFLRTEYRTTEVGRWWGRIETDDGSEDEDIDIVAEASDRNGHGCMLAAECKFRRRGANHGDLCNLQRRWRSTGERNQPKYIVFSAMGFNDELVEDSEDGLVTLFGLEDLMGRTELPDLDGLRHARRSALVVLDAVDQPLVDPVGLLAGEEHGGDLHERVLRTLDDLHIVQGMQPPALGGLLQTDLGLEVVGDEDDGLEILQSELLGGHYPVVAVHQEEPLAPLHDDQGLVEPPLQLVLAADELVHVDLLLGRDDLIDGDVLVDHLEPEAVLLLQEVLDGHDLPRTGLLDLGADDVDVGYDAHQLLVVVHHGKVPETVPEQDAGGIVRGHGRDGAQGSPLHDRADLGVGLVYVPQELLGGDESQEISFLGYRESVEVGVDDLLPHLLDRHVRADRVDVPDHVLSDCGFWHRGGDSSGTI